DPGLDPERLRELRRGLLVADVDRAGEALVAPGEGLAQAAAASRDDRGAVPGDERLRVLGDDLLVRLRGQPVPRFDAGSARRHGEEAERDDPEEREPYHVPPRSTRARRSESPTRHLSARGLDEVGRCPRAETRAFRVAWSHSNGELLHDLWPDVRPRRRV